MVKSEEKNKSSDNTNPYNAKPWAWCHVNRKSKHRLLQELHMMWSSNYKGQWKKRFSSSNWITSLQSVHMLKLHMIRVMMFNATFNNISIMSWQSLLLVEAYSETTDLPQVTDNRSHDIMLTALHCRGSCYLNSCSFLLILFDRFSAQPHQNYY
jgi:hypothetical protein